MKLPSLFKSKETSRQTPWQWTSCKHPKTFSFRVQDDIFKTVNSVFFDPNDGVETPDSWFTNSVESASFSTESGLEFDGESLEMVIRGARSEERLFFDEAGADTSSILTKAKSDHDQAHEELLLDDPLFKESVVLAMDSDNPYFDFKMSMEEMVEIHGLKDWKCLEELLGWYLRMNGKKHHGFIVDAFVDLLVGLAKSNNSCSHQHHHHDSTSYCSAGSSFASSLSRSRLYLLEDETDEVDDEEEKMSLS